MKRSVFIMAAALACCSRVSSAGTATDYAGTYSDPYQKMTYVVTEDGAQLRARIVGQDALPFSRLADGQYFSREAGAYIEFVRQNGRVAGLLLKQHDLHFSFYRVDANGSLVTDHLEPAYSRPVVIDNATLEGYVGQYRYTDAHYFNIYVVNGHVFAQLQGQQSYEIYPSAKDHFYYKEVDAQIDFIRSNGSIVAGSISQNGYTIQYDRVTP